MFPSFSNSLSLSLCAITSPPKSHPALSLSALVFYLRICCWNPNERSILCLCHFPTEDLPMPDTESGRKGRGPEKRERGKEFFSGLPPPAAAPSSCGALIFLPPTLWLLGSTLLLYSAQFLQTETQRGSCGEAEDPWERARECAGSGRERKAPNKLYTRCIMLYAQTDKHKGPKTKGVN